MANRAISPDGRRIVVDGGYLIKAQIQVAATSAEEAEASAIAAAQSAEDAQDAVATFAASGSLGAAVAIEGSPVTIGYVGDLAALTLTGGYPQDANVIYPVPFPKGTTVRRVRIKAFATGNVHIRVYQRTSAYAHTMVAETTVTCDVVGINDIAGLSLRVPDNGYLAINGQGVIGVAAGSEGGKWSGGTIAAPDFTDATANLATIYAIQIITAPVEVVNDAALKALTARVEEGLGALVPVVAGSAGTAGTTDVIGGGGANKWRLPAIAYPNGGRLDSVDFVLGQAIDPSFATFTRTGNAFAIHDLYRCPVMQPGTYNLPVDLEIPAGGDVGVYVQAGFGARSEATQWSLYISGVGEDAFTDATAEVVGAEAVCRFNTRAATIGGVGDVLASSANGSLLTGLATVFVGGAGQSNMVAPPAAVSTRREYGALGFANNGTALLPLRAPDVGTSEYPGFGAAAYLRQRMMADGLPGNYGFNPVIMGRAANGGTAIDDLDKGASYYANGLAQLAAAKASAGERPFVHLGQMWAQGERDADLGTASATYKARLIQLAKDYDADSRPIAGGTHRRPTFVMQTTSALSYAAAGLAAAQGIARAQLEASRESDLVCLVAPGYADPYEDDRHLSGSGSRRFGARFARAMYLYATTGALFQPLQVIDSWIDGMDVVLVYNRPVVRDTTLVPAQTRDGFEVRASGGNLRALSAVTISGATVRLTLASATPTPGHTWSYASFAATGMGTYAGGAGNIRDAAGAWGSIDGVALHDWAVMQGGVLA